MEINGKTVLLLMKPCFIWVVHTGVAEFATLRQGEKVSDKHKFVKRDPFARGFMAWAGVSYR